MTSRTRTIALAIALAGTAVGLYLTAGVTRAYLAADDFQWLLGGLTFEWPRLLHVSGREHFYRPAVELWFAGAVRVCGPTPGCYHIGSLLVHAANVSLVFALARGVLRSTRLAALATLLFAAQPAYTQAVVWVSAVTGLLATLGVLTALSLQMRAWQGTRSAPWYEWGAVASFAVALGAHEAAVTLPVISWLLHRSFAPPLVRWRRLALGFGIVLAAFAATAWIANRENYVFTGGHYRLGAHAIEHAVDYAVTLWVGPHEPWAYVLSVAAWVVLLAASTETRFGALWIAITFLPYLGFTWANVSRYSYLPAIGVGLALAGVGAWIERPIGARVRRIVVTTTILLIVGRFGVYAHRGIRGEVDRLDAWRIYADQIRDLRAPPDRGVLNVPQPPPQIDVSYLEPMCRWLLRDPDIRIAVIPR